MSGYTKLFSSILQSTVWQEPNATKVVWIAMLALSGKTGVVEASIPGLARTAGVTIEECEVALKKFQSPDPYSRSKDFEGRRVAEVDGGWRVLNHGKYRALLSKENEAERNAERQKRHREKKKTNTITVTPSNGTVTVNNPIPDPSSDASSSPTPTTPQRSKTSVVVTERAAEKRLGSAPANGSSRSQVELIPAVEPNQLDKSAAPPALAEGGGGKTPPPPPKPKAKRKDEDSPRGRLFAYWRDELWPKIGDTGYLETKADFAQLSAALKKLSEADVRKALERAVDDPFWRNKSLAQVCSPVALNQLLANGHGKPTGNGSAQPVGKFDSYCGRIDFLTGKRLDGEGFDGDGIYGEKI